MKGLDSERTKGMSLNAGKKGLKKNGAANGHHATNGCLKWDLDRLMKDLWKQYKIDSDS
ncbi:MAG: hypothetical protein HY606_12825 [Planctomycetes bacterium]|nr:hypothetical protein [Planctomycetota bacterium]